MTKKQLYIPEEQIDEVVLDGQLRVIAIYYKKENPTIKEDINRLTQIFEDIETINSLKEDLHNIRKAQFEDVKEFERLYKENDELKEEIETLRYRLSSYETK